MVRKTSKKPVKKQVKKPPVVTPQPVKLQPIKIGQPTKQLTKRLFLVLPTIIALAVAIFFYYQWQQTLDNPQQAVEQRNQKDIDQIVSSVGKLMLLPPDETPSLVTIDNVDEINNNQEFFINAQNGDKMLVYSGIKKAILYRPSTNQIINVAPVSFDNNQPSQSIPSPQTLVTPSASESGQNL